MEETDLADPIPDVYLLFNVYNDIYFGGKLTTVSVQWSSKRMTSCAGLCRYESRGGMCTITLSEPLLKFRPSSDLKETLLHEMIHAHLFLNGGYRFDRDDHGPRFKEHMSLINAGWVDDPFRPVHGYHVTIYHSFRDEVALYLVHWWRCPHCDNVVKRSMNRPPTEKDCWQTRRGVSCNDPRCAWHMHQRHCGGEFVKCREPEGFGQKKKKSTTTTGKRKLDQNDPASSASPLLKKGTPAGNPKAAPRAAPAITNFFHTNQKSWRKEEGGRDSTTLNKSWTNQEAEQNGESGRDSTVRNESRANQKTERNEGAPGASTAFVGASGQRKDDSDWMISETQDRLGEQDSTAVGGPSWRKKPLPPSIGQKGNSDWRQKALPLPEVVVLDDSSSDDGCPERRPALEPSRRARPAVSQARASSCQGDSSIDDACPEGRSALESSRRVRPESSRAKKSHNQGDSICEESTPAAGDVSVDDGGVEEKPGDGKDRVGGPEMSSDRVWEGSAGGGDSELDLDSFRWDLDDTEDREVSDNEENPSLESRPRVAHESEVAGTRDIKEESPSPESNRDPAVAMERTALSGSNFQEDLLPSWRAVLGLRQSPATTEGVPQSVTESKDTSLRSRHSGLEASRTSVVLSEGTPESHAAVLSSQDAKQESKQNPLVPIERTKILKDRLLPPKQGILESGKSMVAATAESPEVTESPEMRGGLLSGDRSACSSQVVVVDLSDDEDGSDNGREHVPSKAVPAADLNCGGSEQQKDETIANETQDVDNNERRRLCAAAALARFRQL